MREPKQVPVVGKDNLTGVLLDRLPERGRGDVPVRIRLSDDRIIEVSSDLLVMDSSGTVLLPLGPADLEPQRPKRIEQEQVIPVVAEELTVDRRAVPTGGVRVNRRLLEHDETIEVPLLKEHLDVRRVQVGEEVDGPLPVRREGDIIIIPIVEEVLVVQKRYVLKEEVQVRRTVSEELHRETVTVRRQEPIIERMG